MVRRVSANRHHQGSYNLVWKIFKEYKGGSTRADKIGVGAGGDIGGTDISYIFMARQYTGPTRQSYRDDHRHVGVMPATPSIKTPVRFALVFHVM